MNVEKDHQIDENSEYNSLANDLYNNLALNMIKLEDYHEVLRITNKVS